MGKSKKNSSSFDSGQSIERGMHRSEDDLGYLDQDLTDDMTITPDSIMTGESTNANTATMRARTKTQSSLQKKRGNQPDM
ncbi:hypothetical protein ABT369_02560 [Dactylosporangium sp. NPDC000244]|uniref:hypothetical protein n=1 Tax=Dactylosporangium sp. NPDC000244 TaxID=3154365 RepID=UPI00331D6596|nr:hypothetical protein GCM10020063_083240 [Dactylosporangium thailandense]